MKKYYCDRCGEEIKGEPLRMVPSFTKDLSMHRRKGLVQLMQPLEDKDFCEKCLAEIVDFALNKNPCDEYAQQMMEENAILREEDEKAGSGSSEPDPEQFTSGAGLDETGRPRIQYRESSRKVAEAMRSIRRECQCQSGQHQEASPADSHGRPE